MQQYDKWLRLAELKQKEFLSRREIEWKLAYWLWGGIVAFTLASLSDKVSLPTSPCWFLIDLGLCIVGLTTYGVVQFLIQYGHTNSKKQYHCFVEKVTDQECKFQQQNACCKSTECFGVDCSGWKWWLAHMLITAMFLFGAWALIVN